MSAPEEKEAPTFSSLPREIRLQIWEHVIGPGVDVPDREHGHGARADRARWARERAYAPHPCVIWSREPLLLVQRAEAAVHGMRAAAAKARREGQPGRHRVRQGGQGVCRGG
ncbi:hypothetical protein J3F83DRAFT_727469 [Trichoderma novae-zelandiae]